MSGSDSGLEPLDAELRRAIASGRAADLPEWHTMSVAEARRVEDEVFSAGGGPAVAATTDREIDGPAGPVPVRMYEPRSEDRRTDPPPALVFCHGGGWVLGTLDSADDLCRQFASRTGAVVVSVDYRLAPEHPFPAAIDDAWAALVWTAKHAQELGIDPERIAVGGTSAGGGLAAALALRARSQAGENRESSQVEHSEAPPVDLVGQILCYPMLVPPVDVVDLGSDHPLAGTTAPVDEAYPPEEAEPPLLSRADVAWFWDLYLGGAEPPVDPLAAPLLADGHGERPPAVVATAGHDALAPEGRLYAHRLREAGASVTTVHAPRLAHGFLSFAADVDRADDATTAVMEGVLDLFE